MMMMLKRINSDQIRSLAATNVGSVSCLLSAKAKKIQNVITFKLFFDCIYLFIYLYIYWVSLCLSLLIIISAVTVIQQIQISQIIAILRRYAIERCAPVRFSGSTTVLRWSRRVAFGARPLGAAAAYRLSLIHIWRCRRSTLCRSRWSPYH